MQLNNKDSLLNLIESPFWSPWLVIFIVNSPVDGSYTVPPTSGVPTSLVGQANLNPSNLTLLGYSKANPWVSLVVTVIIPVTPS